MSPRSTSTPTTSSTSHENDYTTRASKRSRSGDLTCTNRPRRPTEHLNSSRNKRSSPSSKDDHKSSRSKPPLSCGECRRLKLKCDRVFPCQSCVKRGCGGICPEGSLTSGRGSRYILANTEQLHEKILQMADRIRDLEDSLQTLHSEHFRCQHGLSATAPSHPLLQGKLLLVKSQLELYGINPSHFAAQSSGPHTESSSEELTDIDVSDDGATQRQYPVMTKSSLQPRIGHIPFDEDRHSSLDTDANIQVVWDSFDSIRLGRESTEGRNADGNHNKHHSDNTPAASVLFNSYASSTGIIPDDLPEEIRSLSASFPLAWSMCNPSSSTQLDPSLNIVQRIRAFLPNREEATLLCRIVRENLLWQLNCIMSEKASMSLISDVYDTAPAELNPRKLSLLLMIFVMGKNVEVSWWGTVKCERTSGQENAQSPADRLERGRRAGLTMKSYHQLARASLCAIPITSRPDLYTVQTLFMMTWYLLVMSEDKQSGFAAWGVMGITAKLAQALGLHREASQLVGTTESQQERRLLFWEILHLDARLSLAIGRPPSFSSTYRDCKRPVCSGPNGIFPNYLEGCYHEFKFAFYEDCLAKVTELSLCTLEPDYTVLLELDRKIRDYEIPRDLTNDLGPPLDAVNNTSIPTYILKMQRFHAKQWKYTAILHLHRAFYSQVLNEVKEAKQSPVSSPEESRAAGASAFIDWPSVLCDRYAPSILATFISACKIIVDLEELYRTVPDISPHYAVFWFNAFCGGVALCLVVSRVPSSPLTSIALRELGRVINVFSLASAKSPKVARSSKILQGLVSKARASHKRWESSLHSGESGIEVAHKKELRTLADHLSQDGSHYTPGLYKAGSTDLPIANDVWSIVHPELHQFLAKLLNVEDDQGSSLPTGGSRDNASTDNYLYLASVESADKVAPQWDMMEDERRPFSMVYDYQGSTEAAPRPSDPVVGDVTVDVAMQAFDSSLAGIYQNGMAGGKTTSAGSNELWYAHHVESNTGAYNVSNNASNIPDYNYALSNFLSNSAEMAHPNAPANIPVEVGPQRVPQLPQPSSDAVYRNCDGVPGPAYFQDMNYGLGVFTNSSSEQYRYNANSSNGWEN